jgi:hypothetical protein
VYRNHLHNVESRRTLLAKKIGFGVTLPEKREGERGKKGGGRKLSVKHLFNSFNSADDEKLF